MAFKPLEKEELELLYVWVDEISLSRPKRNIARDFSDGVLMAEVVKHFFPKLVQLHNYSSASSYQQKMYNWNTLIQKVFKKIQFQVSKEEIDAVVRGQPGAIEHLLKNFQVKVTQMQQMKLHTKGDHNQYSYQNQYSERSTERDGNNSSTLSNEDENNNNSSNNSVGRKQTTKYADNSRVDNAATIQEKDAQIQELVATVQLLEKKVTKLNHLLKLKESKIDALSARIREAGL